MTPREQDRFDKIARELFNDATRNRWVDWCGATERIAAALRAVETETLERAAQVVDDEDEGPHGMDYQLGDVSDFRARCVKAIRALKQSHERSNDEVANVELRMSSTAVDAAGVGRDAPVPPQGKAPSHPAGDALKSPAAAPTAEAGKSQGAEARPTPEEVARAMRCKVLAGGGACDPCARILIADAEARAAPQSGEGK